MIARRAKSEMQIQKFLGLAVRTFAATAAVTGIVGGAIVSLIGDIGTGMKFGLLLGSALGIFMAIVFPPAYILAEKKASKEAEGKVSHTRRLLTDKSLGESIKSCIRSLGVIGVKSKIKKIDESQGVVEAKTSIRWQSFGETITFDMKLLDNDVLEIAINSRPSMGVALEDGGLNRQNVEKIFDFLRNDLGLLEQSNVK